MAGTLTLALIKPHVLMERNIGAIITEIEQKGFGIILCKMLQLHKQGAEEFYQEHKDKPFFDNLVEVMSKGPLWVLVLSKTNAVEEWRTQIGSTDPSTAQEGSLRFMFGDHQNVTNNAVHGSSSDHAARDEINFFFAREIKLADKVEAINRYEL